MDVKPFEVNAGARSPDFVSLVLEEMAEERSKQRCHCNIYTKKKLVIRKEENDDEGAAHINVPVNAPY
jgi:hypothetical protein